MVAEDDPIFDIETGFLASFLNGSVDLIHFAFESQVLRDLPIKIHILGRAQSCTMNIQFFTQNRAPLQIIDRFIKETCVFLRQQHECQRLSDFDTVFRSFLKTNRHHFAQQTHVSIQLLIHTVHPHLRPISEMYRCFPGQIPIEFLGQKRRKRSHKLAQGGQNLIQRLIRLLFVIITLILPKTLAAPTDIPVRELIDKRREESGRAGKFIRLHRLVDIPDQNLKLRKHPTIKKVRRWIHVVLGSPFVDRRVHHEERIRIPQHTKHITRHLRKIAFRKIEILSRNDR